MFPRWSQRKGFPPPQPHWLLISRLRPVRSGNAPKCGDSINADYNFIIFVQGVPSDVQWPVLVQCFARTVAGFQHVATAYINSDDSEFSNSCYHCAKQLDEGAFFILECRSSCDDEFLFVPQSILHVGHILTRNPRFRSSDYDGLQRLMYLLLCAECFFVFLHRSW